MRGAGLTAPLYNNGCHRQPCPISIALELLPYTAMWRRAGTERTPSYIPSPCDVKDRENPHFFLPRPIYITYTPEQLCTSRERVLCFRNVAAASSSVAKCHLDAVHATSSALQGSLQPRSVVFYSSGLLLHGCDLPRSFTR